MNATPILLAQELGARELIIDDLAGRRAAKRRNLHSVRTLGVLRLAADRRLLDFKSAVNRLRATNFQSAMQLAALQAGEARLPKPQFQFSVPEIVAVYKQKHREPGIWFELADGRVYHRFGDADTTNPDDYAA